MVEVEMWNPYWKILCVQDDLILVFPLAIVLCCSRSVNDVNGRSFGNKHLHQLCGWK